MPQTPITVEVIAYAPVAFFHCQHCELIWQDSPARTRDRREQLESALPDDLKQQYQQLSDWVRGMVATHQSRLAFRIVDAASVEGWFKSLRYGVRQYPAVIVDGKEKVVGTSFERATALIEQRLAAASSEPRFRPPTEGRLE
ncbi:MAG TPA: DUF1525 domain-containing protein [Gemmatimonadales bacterium]|nr:DUF1525 domain-containing protein [Gemmatimonadales bacterium]